MITKNELQNYLTNGATLNKNGEAVTLAGYQVSFFDGPEVDPSDIEKVLDVVNEFLRACPAGAFVGLWLNDSGLVCVDYSENVAKLSEAMKKGIERKQSAIFDWVLSRCISTK